MVKAGSRVALITGGTRGIGLGIAKALGQAGWNLAISGIRSESEVVEVVEELRTLGGEVVYCQGDVGTESGRRQTFESAKGYFNRLDALVNNAGITSPGRLDILEATPESFDKVMAVNFAGAFHLTQMAARWMIEQRDNDADFAGTIINISSISADLVSVDRGDYCISWACLSATTHEWADRLAPFGINVYELRPGLIKTDMTKGVTEKYDRLIEDGLTSIRRWGLPEDVGNAVKLLVSRELTYATGNTLYIDGGLVANKSLG